MNVSSIFSSAASDPLSQLYAPASTSSTTDASSTTDTSSATSTSVSSTAKLLQELQNLQQNDPAAFKKVTADIAAKLQAAAQQVGGSQGQALSSLADKFQQASQTGSLAPLKSGHHGHHHGGGAPPASDSTTATDPTDPFTSTTSVTTSTASSATSAAIAAYQQNTGQSSPFAQADSIISQVLTQDLGSAATAL